MEFAKRYEYWGYRDRGYQWHFVSKDGKNNELILREDAPYTKGKAKITLNGVEYQVLPTYEDELYSPIVQFITDNDLVTVEDRGNGTAKVTFKNTKKPLHFRPVFIFARVDLGEVIAFTKTNENVYTSSAPKQYSLSFDKVTDDHSKDFTRECVQGKRGRFLHHFKSSDKMHMWIKGVKEKVNVLPFKIWIRIRTEPAGTYYETVHWVYQRHQIQHETANFQFIYGGGTAAATQPSTTVDIAGRRYKIYVKVGGEFVTVKQAWKKLLAANKAAAKKKKQTKIAR